MPDSHSLATRPFTVVDTSESIKTGHWYEATRPLGSIRADLLEAVGWISSDPGRQVPTQGPDGKVRIVSAASRPPNVLFILPKEGTVRYRQWGLVLNYLETALVGRRDLSAQHVQDAKDDLDETKAQLVDLEQARGAALANIAAERDADRRRIAEERSLRLEVIARAMEHVDTVARQVAEASRRTLQITVPPGALGDPAAPPLNVREELPTTAPAALVRALEIARELARRKSDLLREIDRRFADADRTWAARLADSDAEFASRLRSAAQRRDSAANRLAGAEKQDARRVHPGIHGNIRAFLDRELLEAARVASDEMRKAPVRASAVAAARDRYRELQED